MVRDGVCAKKLGGPNFPPSGTNFLSAPASGRVAQPRPPKPVTLVGSAMSRLIDVVSRRAAAGSRFARCCALSRAKRVLNSGTPALPVSSAPRWWHQEPASGRTREPGAANSPRRSQATIAAPYDRLQANDHLSGVSLSVPFSPPRALADRPQPSPSRLNLQTRNEGERQASSKEAPHSSLSPASVPPPALVREYYPNGHIPSELEIAAFLRRNCWYHVQSRYTNNELCVKCPESHQEKNLLATGRLSREDGSFYCTECKLRGGWACFANRAAAVSPAAQQARLVAQGEINNFRDAYANVQNYSRNLQALPEEMIKGIEKLMGVPRETLKKYGVGYVTWPAGPHANRKADSEAMPMETYSPENEGVGYPALPAKPQINPDPKRLNSSRSYITFPRTGIAPDEGGDPQVVRLRLLPYEHGGLNDDKAGIMDPPKEPVTPGLFGLHTVPLNQAKITICGSEIDAMAVYKATGEPAVALDLFNQLPLNVLPLLERFVRIELWFEDTPTGRAAAESHAAKLGVNRTWIVSRHLAAIACDTVSMTDNVYYFGLDLNVVRQGFGRAEKLAHKDVLRFSDLRRHVHQYILNPRSFAGIKSNILPDLDRVFKGLRRGAPNDWFI
ncbi:MAG: hypothetical protein BJ554DRAFT_3050, partial [Olpidium bornovanus]